MGKLVGLLNILFLGLASIGSIYVVVRIYKFYTSLGDIQAAVFIFLLLGFLWIFNSIFLS